VITETASTLWRRLRWIIARFDEQNCLTIAGSLTFTSLLALVPAMTVVYLGLAFLPAYAALATQAEDFIFENFIPSSSLLVQEKLTEFAGRAEGLTELGLLGLALTTLMLLLSIERHFNAIWQVDKPKWTLARVLLLIVLLTIGPALVLTGISVSTYLLSLPLLATVDIIGIAPLALNHLPTLCLFVVFSCLFAFVPNAVVGAREALLGGLLTTLAFKMAFALFAWFPQYFVYNVIYGALAVLPVFLLWLFLVWVIVLLGAIFVCSMGGVAAQQDS
jgi:membrane protein